MSETLECLRSMTETDLIKKHDQQASHTQVGVNLYLQELERRDNEKIAKSMLSYTKWITLMTLVVLLATIANLIFIILK